MYLPISLKSYKIGFFFIFISFYLFSEEFFNFEGSLRFRGEVQKGFDIKSYGKKREDDFFLSRLRLNFKVKPSKKIEIFMQIQDSRVYGTYFKEMDFEGKNDPFRDPFDINNLYLKYKNKNIEIKAGRQSISFGDKRIFGPGEWGNTGRYIWDAVLLSYNKGKMESNFFFGSYILHQPDIFPDKRVDGLWAFGTYNKINFGSQNLDYFYVHQRDGRGNAKGESGTSDLKANYIGIRFYGNLSSFIYDGSLIKEWGYYGKDDIDSYGIVLNTGFLLKDNFKLNFQYVQGSGDKNHYDGRHNTFDGIFGGADTVLYGWMNLFFFKNLIEYRVEFINDLGKKSNLRLEYHYFLLDEKKDGWYSPSGLIFRDKDGKSGKNLGFEFDLIFNYKHSKGLEFLIGSSFFKPSEFVRKNFGKDKAKWYFIQSTINF